MAIKIGSRKSPLAIKQTEEVVNLLKRKFPSETFEIVKITTTGDAEQSRELASFGGKGVFIKEIEAALLSGEIDMAVHSAKDLPTDLPYPLTISAAPLRADRRDVLVHFNDDIRVIATGSARRRAQAQMLFPNAVFKPIRGNIHTRIEKVKSGEYDAVIMAKAALDRLDIKDVKITDLGDNFVCAAGQGIIAVEAVKGRMTEYTDAINDAAVMAELTAERAFLKAVGGGCHAPCGASAVYNEGQIRMKAYCAENEKDAVIVMIGSDPIELGKKTAEKILADLR